MKLIDLGVLLFALIIALFVGKTSIEGGSIDMERPFTAIFAFLTIVFAWLDL